MYREQILSYAKANEFVKPRPGADLNAIQKAETAISCTFPDALRSLLSEMDGDGYLFFSAEEMAETNTRVRAALGEDYEGLDFLLFFAGNGCGDYYCYRILPTGETDPNTICIWLHEDNETICVAHSLTELIDRYFGDEI